jgi:hypothetical protein
MGKSDKEDLAPEKFAEALVLSIGEKKENANG